MATVSDTAAAVRGVDAPAGRPQAPAFGVNEMRLDARHWLAVAAIVLAFAVAIPRVWKRIERFDVPPDYRIPYALSSDYWLYQRRLDALDPAAIPVLGDSVVWGEYVRPDGTLTYYLSAQDSGRTRFSNCGLNGVFPLAMEGLIDHYAGTVRDRRVIVQCNVLWMTSPKADLSSTEEQTFNHPELVPQRFGAVPCYRADAATRVGYVAQRNLGFFAWVQHVDAAYFDQMSVPNWTLRQDDRDPPGCPNAWTNPFRRITLRVPGEPENDPQRGPASPRHRAWDAGGAKPQHFDWVAARQSLQWRAFQRTVLLLRSRGNHVLVLLSPFNAHMVAEDQRPVFEGIRAAVTGWLAHNGVEYVAPDTLPSSEYADASHPLTQGYADLAARISADPGFRRWISPPR